MSTDKKGDAVSIPAVKRRAHRMVWRTQCLGVEAMALPLCEEGSEYVAETVEAWEGSGEWEAWDAERRGRAPSPPRCWRTPTSRWS